jgi:hypothetical protein
MFVMSSMRIPPKISNTTLKLGIALGIGLGITLLAACFGFGWWKNHRDSTKSWGRRHGFRTKRWIAKQDKGNGEEVHKNDIKLQDL